MSNLKEAYQLLTEKETPLLPPAPANKPLPAPKNPAKLPQAEEKAKAKREQARHLDLAQLGQELG